LKPAKRGNPSARSGNQSACFSDVGQSKTLRLKRLSQEELKMLKYDKLWDGNGSPTGFYETITGMRTMASKAFKNHSLKSSQLPKIIRTKIEQNQIIH
jgi:hypothetical protein